jgi:hypothetical protein
MGLHPNNFALTSAHNVGMHSRKRKNRMAACSDTSKSIAFNARRPATPEMDVRLGGYYFYFRGDIRRGG